MKCCKDLQEHPGACNWGTTDGEVTEGQGRLPTAPVVTCSQAEEPLPRHPHLPRILSSRKGKEPEPAIGRLLLESLWGELHLQGRHRDLSWRSCAASQLQTSLTPSSQSRAKNLGALARPLHYSKLEFCHVQRGLMRVMSMQMARPPCSLWQGSASFG